MEQKRNGKRGGRPRLPEEERRQNVTLMLTTLEIKQLRKEHEGYVVDFGVFLREKLMNREAITLSKSIDPEVRAEITNLLKMSGMLLLLAKRTEYNVLVSHEFTETATKVKETAQKAHFNVNEMIYSRSLISKVIRFVTEVKRLTLLLQQDTRDAQLIIALLKCVAEIEDELQIFYTQFRVGRAEN